MKISQSVNFHPHPAVPFSTGTRRVSDYLDSLCEVLGLAALSKRSDLLEESATAAGGASDAPGLDCKGASLPASDLLDGYFDFVSSPNGMVDLVIGEGTNVHDPGLFANSIIPHYFRASVTMEPQEPTSLAGDLNDIVCSGVNPGSSVTCFYAHYSTKSRLLRYVNAGHHAPLLVRTNPDEVIRLNAGGPALGAELTSRYTEGKLQLKKGDRLLAFTQGVVNSWATENDASGEASLIRLIRESTHRTATEIANLIVHKGREHSKPKHLDRIVMVAQALAA